MHKLEDLKIWHKSIEIVEKVYELTAQFPKEEKYGLISQIRRCAVSVSSNIAEGAGRTTKGEFRNFLSIASGSAYELFTQLILSYRLNITTKDEVQPIINDVVHVQKMLYKLMKHFSS